MKITDAEIRKIVKEAVKRTMLIKEAENLTALRRLIIKAEQTALDFEKNIVNELDLISPDSMDEKTQRVYLHIVASLKRSLVSAVIDAAKELNKLPKASPIPWATPSVASWIAPAKSKNSPMMKETATIEKLTKTRKL